MPRPILLHQGLRVFLGQVGVSRRRRQVCVAHRFLDVRRILPLGQPLCDATMPEVALHELGRKFSPFCCSLEGIVQ